MVATAIRTRAEAPRVDVAFGAWRLRNLCPHPVHLYDGSRRVMSIPSHGVARCEESPAPKGIVSVGGVQVPMWDTDFGRVVGLPDPEPWVLLVVSPVLASCRAVLGRSDLVVPFDLVRNDEGTVIGARGLARLRPV